MKNRTAYKNQWQKDKCDRINFTTRKGRKAEIKAAAESQGKSLNLFINDAIDTAMKHGKSPSD